MASRKYVADMMSTYAARVAEGDHPLDVIAAMVEVAYNDGMRTGEIWERCKVTATP